jgi:hypothetical protein
MKLCTLMAALAITASPAAADNACTDPAALHVIQRAITRGAFSQVDQVAVLVGAGRIDGQVRPNSGGAVFDNSCFAVVEAVHCIALPGSDGMWGVYL